MVQKSQILVYNFFVCEFAHYYFAIYTIFGCFALVFAICIYLLLYLHCAFNCTVFMHALSLCLHCVCTCIVFIFIFVLHICICLNHQDALKTGPHGLQAAQYVQIQPAQATAGQEQTGCRRPPPYPKESSL